LRDHRGRWLHCVDPFGELSHPSGERPGARTGIENDSGLDKPALQQSEHGLRIGWTPLVRAGDCVITEDLAEAHAMVSLLAKSGPPVAAPELSGWQQDDPPGRPT
jgi:hypothetical protein